MTKILSRTFHRQINLSAMRKQKATAALPYNPKPCDVLRSNTETHRGVARNNCFATKKEEQILSAQENIKACYAFACWFCLRGSYNSD